MIRDSSRGLSVERLASTADLPRNATPSDRASAGVYDDKSKLTISVHNLPVATSGGSCPLPTSTTSTFNATYTFSPGVSDAS